MKTSVTDNICVHALIENVEDLLQVESGIIGWDQVRRVEMADAVIDTTAVRLSMPKRLIAQLGLRPYQKRRFRTIDPAVVATIYSAVRLTVQGRDFTADVAETCDDEPVLIGLIPLGGLDFVVDPIQQRLIGNPEHGGKHMIDIL